MATGIIKTVQVRKKQSFSSRITEFGRTLEIARGNGFTLRIIIYDADGEISDLGDHSTLKVAYMEATRTGDAYAVKSASINDATFTQAQADAGTHYHAEFAFTESDMNPSLGGALSKSFWLVVYGLATVGGGEITHGGGTLTIVEDGTENTATTPAGPDPAVTADDVATIVAAALLVDKLDATVAPTVTNDSSEDYAVGSKWVDVTADRAYICVDASVGAAVWVETGVQNRLDKLDATAAPTTGDDTGDGYSVGSLWVNLTADRAYICVDASSAAAVWVEIGVQTRLDKLDATAAPTTDDDSGDGYSVGSLWIDVTGDDAYLCVDASSAAAVWLLAATNAATDTRETVILHDVKGAAVAGGTATSGSYETRDLNTVVAGASFVSLTSNQFTPTAGDWKITASAPAYKVNGHHIDLYDVTNTAVLAVGTTEISGSSNTTQTRSHLSTVVTLDGSTALSIRHQVNTTLTTQGYGVAHGITGVDTIYTMVMLEPV